MTAHQRTHDATAGQEFRARISIESEIARIVSWRSVTVPNQEKAGFGECVGIWAWFRPYGPAFG
jgi:hypothetical protein